MPCRPLRRAAVGGCCPRACCSASLSPEEGTLLEEFNELAYDECKRLADSFGDIVDDECLDYYENGTWLKDIYFSSGAWADATPPGFTCAE